MIVIIIIINIYVIVNDIIWRNYQENNHFISDNQFNRKLFNLNPSVMYYL